MKKLITLFALIFLILSFNTAYADLLYFKKGKLDNNGVRTYRWEVLDTDANGNVTGTTSSPISGYIVGVHFMPDDAGSAVLNCQQLGCPDPPGDDNAPSNNWDLELKDQYGQDVLMGLGTDIPNLYNTDYTLYRTPITRDDSSNNVSLIYISGAKLTPSFSGLGTNNGAAIELFIKEQGAVRGRP